MEIDLLCYENENEEQEDSNILIPLRDDIFGSNVIIKSLKTFITLTSLKYYLVTNYEHKSLLAIFDVEYEEYVRLFGKKYKLIRIETTNNETIYVFRYSRLSSKVYKHSISDNPDNVIYPKKYTFIMYVKTIDDNITEI